MTQLSVIVVTHNPRRDLLEATLASIARQTLQKSEFEVILVDNASVPPLAATRLNLPPGLDARIVEEPELGIVFARCAGIRAAVGELLVFVDDDNQIDAGYLETSLRIAAAKPEVGAFGGICVPAFEGAVAEWKMQLLPYLGVRDHGPEPIVSRSGEWGPWEPIGAGMVMRRNIGLEFVRIVAEHPEARRLGRCGTLLMSGEDTLAARSAWLLGYACSYEPELRLSHIMKARRFSFRVLARTLLGHGRSYVVLERLIGRTGGKAGWRLPLDLVLSYCSRLRAHGLRAGTICWFWDLGRAFEIVRQPPGFPPLCRRAEEAHANFHRNSKL